MSAGRTEEARPLAERIITLGKRGGLANLRLAERTVKNKDILNKVRFISRYYGEDEQIAPQTVPQNDEVAQFIARIEQTDDLGPTDEASIEGSPGGVGGVAEVREADVGRRDGVLRVTARAIRAGIA